MWRASRYVDGVELGVHVPYYFDEKGVHAAALDEGSAVIPPER